MGYHATRVEVAKKILNEGFIASSRGKIGRGVYLTPFLDYLGPKYLKTFETIHGRKFKFVLEVAVKPGRIIDEYLGNEWTVEPQNVRVYGLLVKAVDSSPDFGLNVDALRPDLTVIGKAKCFSCWRAGSNVDLRSLVKEEAHGRECPCCRRADVWLFRRRKCRAAQKRRERRRAAGGGLPHEADTYGWSCSTCGYAWKTSVADFAKCAFAGKLCRLGPGVTPLVAVCLTVLAVRLTVALCLVTLLAVCLAVLRYTVFTPAVSMGGFDAESFPVLAQEARVANHHVKVRHDVVADLLGKVECARSILTMRDS